MALDYTITHHYDRIHMDQKVFEDIICQATWEKTPTFLTQGRTAWYKLDKYISIDGYAPMNLKAVKMKGVGVWNPKGRHAEEKQEIPIPPTSKVYEREGPHFGFNSEGKIVMIHSEDAPYGGICHHRAVMEYENARRLFEAGVPSIVPFVVIKYNGLYFREKELGAVLSLCPEDVPYRFLFLGWEDKYVDKEILDYYRRVQKRLGVEGRLEDADTRLKISVIIAEQYGKAVRGFSEAGLFIHSGGWENIQFDMENAQVFLTDLDSSKDQEILPERMRPIQAVRDFVSNLFRYVNKVYYPKAIRLYTLENLLRYDIVFHLIQGYMPEIPDGKIKEISEKIWHFFMPYFTIMKKNQDNLDTIPKNIRKSFKFDTDLFYLLCLNLLYPEFLKANSSVIKSDVYTIGELRENTREYLGDRYQYLDLFLKQ